MVTNSPNHLNTTCDHDFSSYGQKHCGLIKTQGKPSTQTEPLRHCCTVVSNVKSDATNTVTDGFQIRPDLSHDSAPECLSSACYTLNSSAPVYVRYTCLHLVGVYTALCPLHISRSDAPIGLRCSRRQFGTKPSDVASAHHSHWPNGAQCVGWYEGVVQYCTTPWLVR